MAEKEVKKPAPAKTYHVSKRASDNMWQVKATGSDKVIKLFKTKVEAEEYSKKMAENQGGALLVHKSKGPNKGKLSTASKAAKNR